MEKIKGTIQAVTKDVKEDFVPASGEMFRVAFLMNDAWYNVYDSKKEVLQELKDTILKKGNVIEFEADGKIAGNINLVEGNIDSEESGEHSWQEDMIAFEDLLSAAHKKAEKEQVQLSIRTSMGPVDFEKKTAIFKAEVIVSKDDKDIQTFQAHGDATQENIASGTIRPHFVRMAETRAIARALRWYTNNAQVADVETK